VRCERGAIEEAERILRTYEWTRDAEQSELSAGFFPCQARLHRAKGQFADALAAAERGLALRIELAVTSLRIKECLVEALEAAFSLGDDGKAEELLVGVEMLHPGEVTPFLRGHTARFRALLDARRGRDEAVDESFLAAEATFREFDVAFYLAVTRLEHAEWLVGQGRSSEAELLLTEARETFDHLEARPWLERVEAVAAEHLQVTA
jgi:ATP/maltotriose-dependent transcriptional regulator MalT